ncbi:MAG: PD-(D/E)XK nuclease family protein [Planctomycetia bacterium]|nr:PD-(D/E)XK nuclease family protein [Planctomycetia bacterium]
MKQDWKISATCISAFKKCPTAFRLAYVEGLRSADDTESQRVGTNWHACLQVAKLVPGGACLCRWATLDQAANTDCPLCGGVGNVPDEEPIVRVTNWLNKAYDQAPIGVEPFDWEVERAILAYSVAGWLWFYQNEQPLETLGTEVSFDLPLRNPATGRSLPHVTVVGKIDRLVRGSRGPMNVEYKSTSKPIDSGSLYWSRMNRNTQVSLYALAARQMQTAGLLPGLKADDPLFAGTLYDVWHKPAIRPKFLTQAETKQFVVDGLYCGQTFQVAVSNDGTALLVDADVTEKKLGAAPKPTKANPEPETPFAVRETPDMFGARLLADIYAEPTKFFARKEIARTDAELSAFESTLYAIYQAMRLQDKNGYWWQDESQCDATFRCPYLPICDNNLAVFDGTTTPPGFRRIFADQAVGEQE